MAARRGGFLVLTACFRFLHNPPHRFATDHRAPRASRPAGTQRSALPGPAAVSRHHRAASSDTDATPCSAPLLASLRRSAGSIDGNSFARSILIRVENYSTEVRTQPRQVHGLTLETLYLDEMHQIRPEVLHCVSLHPGTYSAFHEIL